MSLSVTVLVKSGTPPYEQIRGQLADLVRSGQLAAGVRLPTVRALAADLGVATNTVARAYQLLEGDGLVQARRRHGTVVTHRAEVPGEAHVSELAGQLVREAHRIGLPDETLLSLVRQRLAPRTT